MAAAECTPFAKVGGLGDVVGSLPQALARLGITTSVIIPKYGSIDEKKYHLRKRAGAVLFEYNKTKHRVIVYTARILGSLVQYYFLDHPFFKSKAIYTDAKRSPRTKRNKDVERFTFFSHAVVEAIHQLHLPVDILHCHDWHTALIPTFVDELAVTKSYPFTPTIYTIHNLPNQGIAPRSFLRTAGMKPSDTPSLLEDYYDLDDNHLNLMKLGILAADKVTTVSPTYAREILSTEYGSGLESFLARRKRDLTGIVNGIDMDFFDPSKDKLLPHRYGRNSVRTGKQANKINLQKKLGLSKSTEPLYGIVSRLVPQKGFDLLLQTVPSLLSTGAQLAILGTGSPFIESGFKKLARQFPRQCAARIGFDERLAHQIYAGSDFFLMPSRYEPCGLGQMIAMRYGTVPIVRATGGLADTVMNGKTGFVFKPYTAQALTNALMHSAQLYQNKKAWYTMVTRCVRQDFSWDASAKKYIELYKKLL